MVAVVAPNNLCPYIGLLHFQLPLTLDHMCPLVKSDIFCSAKVVMILRHLLHFDLIHLIPGIGLDNRYRPWHGMMVTVWPFKPPG